MSAFVRVVPRISRSSVLTRSLRLQLRCYASYPEHTIIGMPALSPTMTQGNLASWTKKEGDQLSPGEVIAEIETDKAQMDFEFQEDGYLAKILVPEGTKDIPVNKPIAVYVEDKADVPALRTLSWRTQVLMQRPVRRLSLPNHRQKRNKKRQLKRPRLLHLKLRNLTLLLLKVGFLPLHLPRLSPWKRVFL